MVNTPIPHSLKSEAKKAAKILSEFSMPTAKAGPDKVIPAGLLVHAEGLAILTVAKLGFLVTARGGSGIVIAKLKDGSWSPPSAIGIAGLGGGLEIGAEVTDFVIVLTKRTAVDAFSKGGNLTLGGNFTIAAGPLGRNLEGDVSLRSPAAIYTYSRTKGLFAGISIEGSCLIERKDANQKFYGNEIRAYEILSGEVSRPEECAELYEVLDKHRKMLNKALQAKAKSIARKEAEKAAEEAGILSTFKSLKLPKSGASGSKDDDGDQAEQARDSSDDDVAAAAAQDTSKTTWTTHQETTSQYHSETSTAGVRRTKSLYSKRTAKKHKKSPPQEKPAAKRLEPQTTCDKTSRAWDAAVICKAIYSYDAQMSCDLTFKKGDRIILLTRTDKQDDWWEGKYRNKVGIFPANYVQVL